MSALPPVYKASLDDFCVDKYWYQLILHVTGEN
jgi:hypothetical protein